MTFVSRVLTSVFLVFWMAFVFLDYWQKHPAYYYSFAKFDYWGLAAVLLLLGAGVVWSMLKYGGHKRHGRWFNGLAAFGLFLLTGVLSVGFAYGKLVENASFSAVKAARVLALTGSTALAVFLIVLACYVLGGMLNERLKLRVKAQDAPVADVAAGVMGLVLALFLLGAVSLLHALAVFPLLAALLFFGRRRAAFFLKTTLLQPLAQDKQLNAVGAGSFFLLACLFSINFAAACAPMPAGFDSLVLYANLPSLIGQQHSLVAGFQPYNWSIFMSLGHVLFDSAAVSLALSNLGGVLAAWAMWVLCRSWLNMNANWSLLAVLAFSLTPSVTIQSSAELKVDLGLLFIYLGVVLVLLNYFKALADGGRWTGDGGQAAATAVLAGASAARSARPEKAVEKKKKPASERSLLPGGGEPEIAWMGLLSGFALGVKLTTVYFAFALVCALWFARSGRRGFLAAFLGCLFLVFLLKMDDFGGLRQHHLGADALQWGALLAACLLAAGAWLQDRQAFQKSLRSTAWHAAFFALPFLPWLVKNGAETRSLSPDKLLNGKQASPNVNLETLELNWKNSGGK